MDSGKKESRRGGRAMVYFCVIAAAFLYGTTEVSLKIAGAGLDSYQITFLRYFAAGIILIPFMVRELRTSGVKLKGRDIAYLLLLGTMCIPVSILLSQLGIMGCTASTSSVLRCTSSLFTIFFAHFMVNERLNRYKLIAAALYVFGIIMLIRPWDVQEGNTVYGLTLVMLSALVFGFYTVLEKGSIKRYGLITQMCVSFLLGSAVMLAVVLATGRPVVAGLAENLPIMIYVTVAVTTVAYLFYFKAINLSDASTASVTFMIKPCIAPFIAVVVLGDSILWNTYVGIVLILAASYLNMNNEKLLAGRAARN